MPTFLDNDLATFLAASFVAALVVMFGIEDWAGVVAGAASVGAFQPLT